MEPEAAYFMHASELEASKEAVHGCTSPPRMNAGWHICAYHIAFPLERSNGLRRLDTCLDACIDTCIDTCIRGCDLGGIESRRKARLHLMQERARMTETCFVTGKGDAFMHATSVADRSLLPYLLHDHHSLSRLRKAMRMSQATVTSHETHVRAEHRRDFGHRLIEARDRQPPRKQSPQDNHNGHRHPTDGHSAPDRGLTLHAAIRTEMKPRISFGFC